MLIGCFRSFWLNQTSNTPKIVSFFGIRHNCFILLYKIIFGFNNNWFPFNQIKFCKHEIQESDAFTASFFFLVDYTHFTANYTKIIPCIFLCLVAWKSKIKCAVFICFRTNHDSFFFDSDVFFCTSKLSECA